MKKSSAVVCLWSLSVPLLLAACGEEARPNASNANGGSVTAGSAGAAAGSQSGASSGGTAGAGGGAMGGSASGSGGNTGASGGGSGLGGAGAGGAGAGASGEAGGGSGVAGQPGGSGGAAGVAGSTQAGSAGTGDAGSGGASGAGGSGGGRPARVLLYSFSTLDIPSVPAQLDIFEEELDGLGYEVDRSEDPARFTDSSLANYAAVGMINTCFYPFGANNMTGLSEAQALQRFLQAGGGLFGTHCADVTFQSANPPALYNQLLGGRASSQNFEGVSECRKTSDHPTTAALPATFNYTGNLDGTDFIADDSVVLVRCRWGNQAGTDVAVSWVRSEGAGRVFFTNFAKVDADLRDATIGENHILSGLAWVLGL